MRVNLTKYRFVLTPFPLNPLFPR